MRTVVDLGYQIGVGVVQKGPYPSVEIIQPDNEEDGVYTPSRSVRVYGAASVKALRDLCTAVLDGTP